MASSVKNLKMQTPTSTSSPLRRRSMILQKEGVINLSENDDEAERQARRQERVSNASTNSVPTSESGKRRSVSLLLARLSIPEIAERVTQCIKLNAENKISIKNAFSLEMIDFMNYMIKKKDSNMSNLQVASTSLDVSTKIYGFRVDGVHTDILKMIGGLDKHAMIEEDKNDNVAQQEGGATQEGDKAATNAVVKKKKKRNKQKIFGTEEALKGTIEIGSSTALMRNDEDLQTTDKLYQAMLPNHLNSGFYLHQFKDIVLDAVQEDGTENVETGDVDIAIPRIDNVQDLEICPSFSNFDFHDWSAEDEVNKNDSEERNDDRFQFDLDASIPRDEGPEPVGMSYFDINDEEENQERCQNVVNSGENIVDLRQVVMVPGPAKPSEYSFIQKGMKFHWAGPSHWKITNFHKNFLKGTVGETCRQAPTRKKKEIELIYSKESKMAVNDKFRPSKAIRIQPKTARLDWLEERITLPEDIHYDIVQSCKLNFHPGVIIDQGDKDDEMNTTELRNDAESYDYNNENDMSNYCPNIDNIDYLGSDNNFDDAGFDDGGTAPSTQIAFTGDNLVTAPKQVSKINIAYSLRQKKIDMRQLKRSIWRSLILSSDKENMNMQKNIDEEYANKVSDNKYFSDVYKTIPTMISKLNVEALTFPITFVSLLHLVNEKTLKVDALNDFSDIIVQQD